MNDLWEEGEQMEEEYIVRWWKAERSEMGAAAKRSFVLYINLFPQTFTSRQVLYLTPAPLAFPLHPTHYYQHQDDFSRTR